MDRPAVQEAVLMGRVMVEAAPVQDFKATRADIVVKAVRATRVVIIIRESAATTVRLPEQPEAVE